VSGVVISIEIVKQLKGRSASNRGDPSRNAIRCCIC
jgi:hypothetical protein